MGLTVIDCSLQSSWPPFLTLETKWQGVSIFVIVRMSCEFSTGCNQIIENFIQQINLTSIQTMVKIHLCVSSSCLSATTSQWSWELHVLILLNHILKILMLPCMIWLASVAFQQLKNYFSCFLRFITHSISTVFTSCFIHPCMLAGYTCSHVDSSKLLEHSDVIFRHPAVSQHSTSCCTDQILPKDATLEKAKRHINCTLLAAQMTK